MKLGRVLHDRELLNLLRAGPAFRKISAEAGHSCHDACRHHRFREDDQSGPGVQGDSACA